MSYPCRARSKKGIGLLPGLVYPSPDRLIDADKADFLMRGQKSLWSLGISGDLPIVTALIEAEEDIETVKTLIPMHKFLSENGVSFDLVYLVRGGGDYRNTLSGRLTETLRCYDHENRIGARGGVHIADTASEGANTILAVSVKIFSPGFTENTPVSGAPTGDLPAPRRFNAADNGSPLEFCYNDDNSVSFDTHGRLPYNAWSHMLANSEYGFVATDAGTGHMWHLNARENKINSWLNDSLATDGTEKLAAARFRGRKFPFSAPGLSTKCRVTYRFRMGRMERKTIG
jgi:cyclic beta-1,2-glucan synthetase